nr:unnamed protein product [Callosobruchus analis]
MEKCLLAATETVRPFVLTGVPDFIPGIQNFSIPRISVKDGNEALNYIAELHNLTMYGLEDYKFNRYYYNPENGTFLINVQLPHLFLKGRYNLNGRIFFAPLKGNGDFHVNITDSSCSVFHTVDIVKRNGTEFMQPTKTLPKMRVGKITNYEFDGLFKDNKDLELLARQVIHENLMVIVDELLPTIEQVLGALFDELIFKSVTKIPYDKLYPK